MTVMLSGSLINDTLFFSWCHLYLQTVFAMSRFRVGSEAA